MITCIERRNEACLNFKSYTIVISTNLLPNHFNYRCICIYIYIHTQFQVKKYYMIYAKYFNLLPNFNELKINKHVLVNYN